MKQINQTNRSKTILSVSPDGIILNIGKDLNENKLKTFLTVLDDFMTGMPVQNHPYYGHFSFSNGTMEICLSYNKNNPKSSDLIYKRSI